MLLMVRMRFLMLLVCVMFLSCTNDKTKVSCTSNGVYRFSSETLYYYEDEHDDSLVCGLSVINKEIRYSGDNQREVYLYMGIEDPNFYTGERVRREVYLTKDEMNRLDVFLDSCLTRKIPDGQRWEVKMNSEVVFLFCKYDRYVVFGCNQGHLLELRITPTRLKEVLEKAKEDD